MPHRWYPRYAALKVLRALEEASETSEGRLGFKFDMDDWYIGGNAFSLEDSSRTNLSAGFISKLSSDRHRLEYIIRLCRTLKKSASELLAIHDRALQPIVSKLSKGISKLPDELLGLIFKFASHDEREGTRHAQWLSEVSQRFRRIALADQTLWSTQFFCYDTFNDSTILRCLELSGDDSDIHIVANCDDEFDEYSVKHFIYPCSREASRWKTLTLDGDWDGRLSLGYETIGGTLAALMADTDLDLPRLDELRLIERRRDKTGALSWYSRDVNFTGETEVLWTTPNLRSLRCTQYIPSPFIPFDSLVTFSLSLTLIAGYEIRQISQLCAFLMEKRGLLEIDLELIDRERSEAMEDEELTVSIPISLPITKTFRFSISRFEPLKGFVWLVVPFFEALEMPNLEHFSLSTDLLEFPDYLFPDPFLHPRITTLCIEAPRLDDERSANKQRNSNKEAQTLRIPLDDVPNVSSLTVTTTLNNVTFSRHDAPGQSRLRELRFQSCRNLDINGLRQSAMTLKNIGAWDGLEHVAIQNCGLLEYDAVEEVTGKKKLYFSRS